MTNVPGACRAMSVAPCGNLPLTVRTTGGGLVVHPGPKTPPEAEHGPAAPIRLTVDRVATVPITLASG